MAPAADRMIRTTIAVARPLGAATCLRFTLVSGVFDGNAGYRDAVLLAVGSAPRR